MSMQPYEQAGELVADTDPAVDLTRWALEAAAANKMAHALANTSFVPQALRGKPDEITAQILYGRDVNLPPMVALQQIHIIEGRPSLSALSMRGLAQAKGVRFRLEESTETRCKMSAKAPQDTEWTSVVWSMDRAKKLGVATKRNWQNQPTAMLIARATSELCRLVAAPLFLGISYSTEELRDHGADLGELPPPAEQPQPEAEKPKTRTVRRTPPAEPKPEPKPDPKPEPKPEAEPYSIQDVQPRAMGEEAVRDDAPSEKTRRALMATFRSARIDHRDVRLKYVSDLLGREVLSVNLISEMEAQKVLRQLRVDYSLWDEPVAEVPGS